MKVNVYLMDENSRDQQSQWNLSGLLGSMDVCIEIHGNP